MKAVRIVAALAAAVVFSSTAFAGPVDKLANALAEKGVISYGEARQIIIETEEDMKQQAAEALVSATPSWFQKIKMTGDIRLRTQVDAAENAQSRVRIRERVRLGFETNPIENVKVAFGLASGSIGGSGDKNPSSVNHTYEAFNKIPIFIDYAYLSYSPVNWFTASAGKVKNGLNLWAPQQLVWKSDVNPDGVALNFNKGLGNGFDSSAIPAGMF